jgi:hypothetical protein
MDFNSKFLEYIKSKEHHAVILEFAKKHFQDQPVLGAFYTQQGKLCANFESGTCKYKVKNGYCNLCHDPSQFIRNGSTCLISYGAWTKNKTFLLWALRHAREHLTGTSREDLFALIIEKFEDQRNAGQEAFCFLIDEFRAFKADVINHIKERLFDKLQKKIKTLNEGDLRECERSFEKYQEFLVAACNEYLDTENTKNEIPALFRFLCTKSDEVFKLKSKMPTTAGRKHDAPYLQHKEVLI